MEKIYSVKSKAGRVTNVFYDKKKMRYLISSTCGLYYRDTKAEAVLWANSLSKSHLLNYQE